MIHLVDIAVRGTSNEGDFGGSFTFTKGLQVISAHNRFGKSLAVTAIAWCLGLERMFGLQDNDPSRFPVAVRDVIELKGNSEVKVTASHATMTIERAGGERLRLTRHILGDPTQVKVEELSADGTVSRSTTFMARWQTMKDEAGGLHNFLFKWAKWPRAAVINNRGEESEVYLENVAPLFYIDQNEGWTDLQALQVYRYGLLDIAEIAVEYLLGATKAIGDRFAKQRIAARDAQLKSEASALTVLITALFQRHGWITNWSDHGAVAAIAKRWSAKTLVAILKQELNVDLVERQIALRERAVTYRAFLTKGTPDAQSAVAPSDASQLVVQLKEERHRGRENLRIIRRQHGEQEDLLLNVEHRLHSAQDILRLKLEGIGRIEVVECPTCHRSLEPSTFQLTSQTAESVKAHIDALSRDRRLVASNIASSLDQIVRVNADLVDVENRLREAERALGAVNQALGASREQITKAATDLVSVENEMDRIANTDAELRELQGRIDSWLERAKGVDLAQTDTADLVKRVATFRDRMRNLLSALGHGGFLAQPTAELHLEENYIPYLGPRRLRSLGSASDHSRLVAAYVIALAEASEEVVGLHPGFVVLDEPLQQNPDEKHRNLFIDFLISETAKKLKSQTIIFTWLQAPELERLNSAGVRVVTPEGDHFLESLSPKKNDVLSVEE